jgi:hypothetical protein
MIAYELIAHPTTYRGRSYRSRLEAKWAAFFDLAGWPFEYEPFDLGFWSPDFLLPGHYYPILCEVKPITAIDHDVCRKMAGAAKAAKFQGELLLLGLSPNQLSEPDWLGWLDSGYDTWLTRKERPDFYEPYTDCQIFGCFHACRAVMYNGRLDFCHGEDAYAGRMTGAWDGDHYVTRPSSTPAADLWADACNTVQWHATSDVHRSVKAPG